MKRGWYRALLRRRLAVVLLLFLQGYCIFYVVSGGGPLVSALRVVLHLLSALIVLHVIAHKDKGANKVTWMFLILLFPVFGGALYLMYHFQPSARRFGRALETIQVESRPLYRLPGDALPCAAAQDPQHTAQLRYLQEFAGFPVYDATRTRYFSLGERFVEPFLAELNKAERYIFLEYFIVEEGVLWGRVLEVLKAKAAQGVEVRLLYDDIGCFLTLPKDYGAQLERYGIRCAVFNPFRPMLTVLQNNRDHRKIASIDGKVAFTGGLNLADEYVNLIEKYGYWKDAVLMVEGKAAWSLTLMFLEMWRLCVRQEEPPEAFYPWAQQSCPIRAEGFVQPYADSPLDSEHVSEHVYMQMVDRAQTYVYITTPYLIVDDSMVSALCLAAKSGVDVRIITPGVPDKKLIFQVTRSYYRELLEGGVQIYEYAKGFMHAKTFVSDDRTATVGTVNLDFRSLYLHFECGVWMDGTDAVRQVKEDFLATLPACRQIAAADCKAGPLKLLFQSALRLVAPLL